MAIPTKNMIGYLRPRMVFTNDDPPIESIEFYVDPVIKNVRGPAGITVKKPANCVGIVYAITDAKGKPTGKLTIEYPEE